MDQVWTVIISNTYTLHSLKNRLRVLKEYLSQKLFATQSVPNLTQEEAAWLNSLGESFTQSFNKDSLSSIFSALETKLNQAQSLTLYLPFEPRPEDFESLGKWVRATFNKPELLLDVKFDPELIAGCALSWKGIYRDYSLRKKIEDNKEQLLGLFKKYLGK